MNRKRGRVVPSPKPNVPYRLSLALRYASVARSQFEADDLAARNVAAGNAALAGIAAADVLCTIYLEVRSASSDHSDAIELLNEVDREAARDLTLVVRDKSRAHYGIAPLDKDTVKRMIRSMERLVQRAQDSAAGLKIQ